MDDDRQMAFMTALVTEHFVLQGARGQSNGEMTGRAALYLATVSGTLIALGFVARDRSAFVPFAAAVLLSLLILGEFTFIRLVAASIEDLEYLYAIQQIRAYYRSLVPDGLMFFADITLGNPRAAVTRAMGMSQSSLNVVYTAGSMIAAINSILAGIGIALILRGAGLVTAVAASCGAITALVIYGLHLRWALSCYAAGLAVPAENCSAERQTRCP
jgi:hypothetical protein